MVNNFENDIDNMSEKELREKYTNKLINDFGLKLDKITNTSIDDFRGMVQAALEADKVGEAEYVGETGFGGFAEESIEEIIR